MTSGNVTGSSLEFTRILRSIERCFGLGSTMLSNSLSEAEEYSMAALRDGNVPRPCDPFKAMAEVLQSSS